MLRKLIAVGALVLAPLAVTPALAMEAMPDTICLVDCAADFDVAKSVRTDTAGDVDLFRVADLSEMASRCISGGDDEIAASIRDTVPDSGVSGAAYFGLRSPCVT